MGPEAGEGVVAGPIPAWPERTAPALKINGSSWQACRRSVSPYVGNVVRRTVSLLSEKKRKREERGECEKIRSSNCQQETQSAQFISVVVAPHRLSPRKGLSRDEKFSTLKVAK